MRNFLKQTFASLIGTILGLAIFSGVSISVLIALIFIAASARETEPVVKNRSVMVFDLGMEITDGEPNSSQLLQEALAGRTRERMNLRGVLDAIEKARRDSRIVGIYLDATRVNSASRSAGLATFKEIRRALEKFRAEGKQIIAYGLEWGEQEYYLSSVADRIVMNPVGVMEINGFSSQPIFFAGALEKYGIGAQILRVGKFKGAVEPFILDKLSPENRAQTQKLLDDVWSEWRGAVGKSRQIDPQKLQDIANNQAILEANTAKQQKLVDQVAYFDEVVKDLRKLTRSNDTDQPVPQISISDYAGIPGSGLGAEKNSKNKIAVVYAEGEIVNGMGEEGQVGGDRFARIFRQLREDKDTKAVVLRINSPGGSATAAEVMQREVRLTQLQKPVVVSMGDVAASGGYWIATDSNRIYAEPNTITGSIGVFGILLNFQKLANDNGITWDAVKTAKYADNQTVSRPKSDEEIALYQRSVNRIYNLFLDKVAQGRKLPQAKVAEIAQGRIWSGNAAKQIGLVDEIGGLNQAIAHAAELAKVGDDWRLREYPRYTSFGQRFFGRAIEETSAMVGFKPPQPPTNPLTSQLDKLQAELAILQTMNDPQGVYARLPFNLKIE